MLVMVPQGCDEASAARLVRHWIGEQFIPPSTYANHHPACIDLVADGLISSAHFAREVATKVARKLQIIVEDDSNDYPTDVLQNAVEAALQAGAYPVLTIERFHAFASIRDGGMASLLSRLRTMEGDGLLTTLAFSPMGYDAIRRKMDSEQPFLNSVYGDMHDEAVMTPLEREDFVAEAVKRGVSPTTAFKLFGLGGGPDVVFRSLLDLSATDPKILIERCAERAGAQIDLFLSRSFPEQFASDGLLGNLAVGRLNAAQEAAVMNHPLASFLCKRSNQGEVICSSPIVARRILSGGLPLWSQYRICVEAIEADDYPRAAMVAGLLNDSHPRLAAFRELVLLHGALSSVPDRGLLGIEWPLANEAMKRLRRIDLENLQEFAEWLDVVEQAISIVLSSTDGQRLQADTLTRLSSNKAVRLVLLFMMDSLLQAVRCLPEPLARVKALVNLPEAILQSLAAGFCDIDFAAPPSPPPVADYDCYFSGKGRFSFPAAGYKLTLGSLMVIVPAQLAAIKTTGSRLLVDPEKMKPLQQKLVDAVRNPASHTIATFVQKDALLLEEVCQSWLDDWCRMEGLPSVNALPLRRLAPQGHHLRALVIE
jgi:hypothetical protein